MGILFTLKIKEDFMGTTQPIREKDNLHLFLDYYKLTRPSPRNFVLITLGLNTALRISDILQLKWEEIYDFEQNTFPFDTAVRLLIYQNYRLPSSSQSFPSLPHHSSCSSRSLTWYSPLALLSVLTFHNLLAVFVRFLRTCCNSLYTNVAFFIISKSPNTYHSTFVTLQLSINWCKIC